MYYIKDIDRYNKDFPDYPIIKRKTPMSINDIFNNTDISEYDLREQIVCEYIKTNDLLKTDIDEIFSNYFFKIIFDNKNNSFYKIKGQQKIPLSEKEKDLLFVILSIFDNSKKSILLDFSHYINNALYEIINNSINKANINIISNDINWVLNFQKEFIFLKNKKYLSYNEMYLDELLGDYSFIYYVEGEDDLLTYSFFYPELNFQVEGGSKHILFNMNRINSNLKSIDKNKAILDSDAFSEKAISLFNEKNIHIIPFSEIENLWLSENILKNFYKDQEINMFKESFYNYTEKNFNNIIKRFTYRQELYKTMTIPFYSETDIRNKELEFKEKLKNKDYDYLLRWIDGKTIFYNLFKNTKIKHFIHKLKKTDNKKIINEIRLKLNIGDFNGKKTKN